MKFPAYFNVEPYLALLPKSVSPIRTPRRKSDLSPPPEATDIGGTLGEEKCDLKSLKEPIHQLFVNWPSDPSGIIKFTQKYGPLDAGDVYRWDTYLKFSFNIKKWQCRQKDLQRLWDKNGAHDQEVVSGFNLLTVDPPRVNPYPTWPSPIEDIRPALEMQPEMRWSYKRDVLTAQIRGGSLYRYMYLRLMFEKLGSLRRCKNPGCATPRFKAGRADQVFCTTDCAELIAKRRWWAEHGNAWRKQRKKLQKTKAKRGKH